MFGKPVIVVAATAPAVVPMNRRRVKPPPGFLCEVPKFLADIVVLLNRPSVTLQTAQCLGL
jgi:hypothetical protein